VLSTGSGTHPAKIMMQMMIEPKCFMA